MNECFDIKFLALWQEIKLSVTKAAAETEAEEDVPASQAATTAKVAHAATTITKLVKKNFVETAIPEIIALKQLVRCFNIRNSFYTSV